MPGAAGAQRHQRRDRLAADRAGRQREQRRRRQGQRPDDERRRRDADRLHAAQLALEIQAADRVAQRGQQHHQAAGERLGVAAEIEAEQQHDADDPDDDARGGDPARALVLVEADGEQRGEDRRRRHEDAGQRRGDRALAVGDQQERQDDLHDRQDHDRRHASAQRAEGRRADRDRHEHERAEGEPCEDDEDRVEAAVQRDLDEQVRRAPDRGEEPHQQPRATGHPRPG